MTARRPEAEAVIDAFLATDMAEGCRRLTAAEAADAVTRLAIVTAGCGASTAFAIGEETVAGLFG
jgi:hypothetical protein